MKTLKQRSLALALAGAIALGGAGAADASPLGSLIQRAEAARANHARVVQEGSGESAAVRQNGEGNSAGVIQFGRNNTGIVTQDGDNNTACLVQLGRNLDGSITQTGDNLSTGIVQTRRGTREIPAEFCSVNNGRPRGLWMAGMRHLEHRLR